MRAFNSDMKKPIPVTIITGFLGSGKTTTILELLKSTGSDSYTAVIINEWGSVALDGMMITGEHPDVTAREISGGCICCGAGSEFERTILDLIDKVRPDRIIIEPSGVAKAGEIIDLLRPHEKNEAITILPTICLVDPARFINEKSMSLPVYRDQVESAAILVANRCDLADRSTMDVFFKKASLLYPPKLSIHATSFGRLPLQLFKKPKPGNLSKFNTANGITTIAPQMSNSKNLTQAGWTWHPDIQFSKSKLMELFSAAAKKRTLSLERAKAVFNTDKGWILMEIASHTFHQRPIQYRTLNGCQLIVESSCESNLPILKSDIDSCIFIKKN